MDVIKNFVSKLSFLHLSIPVVAVILLAVGYYFFIYKKSSTSESFQSSDSGTSEFILFYVDWCGYCKTAKPEFEQILSVNQVNGKPIKITAVNAEKEVELAKKYGVKGYPTIILLKGGEKTVYEGGRTKDEFMSFLNQNM